MHNIKKFKRVIVINRGEIAIRVFRALRDLGIESVAIYSDADIECSHIKYADYAFTCGSMIVLEFSLYGLPCLEFCVEKVFSFQKPDLNKIKDMIYGDFINFNQIKNNTKNVIETFIQSEIKKPKDIPYYQNCDDVNLSDIVNKIIINS